VTSVVGIVPLALHYSFDVMLEFLRGASDMDQHFYDKGADSLPALLGLFGIWNSSFLGYGSRALIPYCEALSRLPAHIQQLDMESNGKSVDIDGTPLPFQAGEVDFGEPGTNAQHSFFQLIHQGRTIPVDFIGFTQSQLEASACEKHGDEIASMIADNHTELMSNLFAQCDALAIGLSTEQVKKEKPDISEGMARHRTFSGDRPSTMILIEGALDAYTTGQLLALFEHRTVVQGFVWGINSFDQWGVELGKKLALKVRKTLDESKEAKDAKIEGYIWSTIEALRYYLSKPSE
jgi:glucose-6-phosphate isomerase